MNFRPLIPVSLLLLSFGSRAVLCAQDPRVENARAHLSAGGQPGQTSILSSGAGEDLGVGQDETPGDDAFGVQQILKRQERVRPFRIYTDVSGSATDNVALNRDNPRGDALFVATFGFDSTWALNQNLSVTGYAREALFRYEQERALDFDSFDIGASLSARFQQLPGVEFFLRYNYNQLYGEQSDETFFKNHTVALGGQKVWAINRALAVYAGASALWGFADPEAAGRDEYSLFTGARLQVSRSFSTEAIYRAGWWPYREGGRRDWNQTAALQLRWRCTSWAELYAAGYYSWNRSNFEVFDYEVGNLGGGLTLQVQF